MPTSILIKSYSPEELAKNVSLDMARDAFNEGMSLSAYLERLNPTDPKDNPEGLDAFQRVLMEMDIRTRSIPSAGIQATKFGDAFDATPQTRIIGREWMNREWKRVAYGGSPSTAGLTSGAMQRDAFQSTDFAIGTPWKPWLDMAGERGRELTPQIPLAALVSSTRGIDGTSYRALYLEEFNPEDVRLRRIQEGSEIPGVRLTEGSFTIDLHKFGRKIESTYEAIRRIELDRVARIIAQMAVQAEADKVAIATDVLINGDGNADTEALVYRMMADLDPRISSTGLGPNSLSMRAYLLFKMKLKNPYAVTTMLGRESAILPLLEMTTGNANNMFVSTGANSGFGGFTVINPSLNSVVKLGILDEVDEGTLLAFDDRVGVERVYEIGSDISEFERRASNQTEFITFTEVEGYNKIDKKCAIVMDMTH